MKVQIIVLTEKQKEFLKSDADSSDIEAWLATAMATSPSVGIFVREDVSEKEAVWGLSPFGVNQIEREIESVIVDEQEMEES